MELYKKKKLVVLIVDFFFNVYLSFIIDYFSLSLPTKKKASWNETGS